MHSIDLSQERWYKRIFPGYYVIPIIIEIEMDEIQFLKEERSKETAAVSAYTAGIYK